MPSFMLLDRGEVNEQTHHDLLIAACGYESRCTQVPLALSSHCSQIHTFAFPDRHDNAFGDHYDTLSKLGTIVTADMSEFSDQVSMLASKVRSSSTPGKISSVAVDISSLDRERIASVVRAFVLVPSETPVDLTFYYSHGKFESHPDSAPETIVINGPVNGFSGWTTQPSDPVACVVGLGFEADLALAALETLEPALTVVLIPQHEADARFENKVRFANASLVRSQSDVRVLDYDLDHPAETMRTIERVVHSLNGRYRIAVVPLGPKLFALCGMLVATKYEDAIAVWRVSLASGAPSIDMEPTGEVTRLSIRVHPRPAP